LVFVTDITCNIVKTRHWMPAGLTC
jgi:hypothetical protein